MIRKKKVMFINLEDIWLDEKAFLSSRGSLVSLHSNEILSKEQYDFFFAQKTFLLDLRIDRDAIFAMFEAKSCRYPINKAVRDEVRVYKAVSEEEKSEYISFQNEFCEGKEIPRVDRNELEELDIYCASSKEGEFLGGCAFILSQDGKTVRYKYGATKHKLNANEAILWKAICEYKDKGFEFFDFGGCVPTEDKESYYYRHFHFKKKFGGELTDSYTYFKTKGIYRLFYHAFDIFVKLFFKGDVNGFVVWMNKRNMIH